MNVKVVETINKNGWGVLQDEKVKINELFYLINEKWTGKIKTIIHAPTTAGINCHITNIDDYQIKCGGGNIWLESKSGNVFCITDLTSVRWETMNGRPNMQADCNGVVIDFYFI